MQTEWWGGLWSAMVAGVVRPASYKATGMRSVSGRCSRYAPNVTAASGPMTDMATAEVSRSAPLPRTQAVAWLLHVCQLRAGRVTPQSSRKSLKTFACAGVPSVGQ
jgi:hypothetical protein